MRRSPNSYVYPGVVVGLLFVVVIWGIIVMVIDFVEYIKNKKLMKDDLIFKMFQKKEKINKI